MLNVFRENLKSLKWVLWLVVAAFVITTFAVWGGGVSQQGFSSGNWAAQVGDRRISIQEFQNAHQNLAFAYRQYLGPEQFEQQKNFLGLGQLALEQLIQDELLLQEASRVGLKTTDRESLEHIQGIPAFQENGRFIGRERVLQILQGNGQNTRDFEEGIKKSLLIGKMRSLIEDGIQTAESEIVREFKRRNESISGEYLSVTPDQIADRIQLAEEEVAAFFDERREAYRLPERRQGEFVLFSSHELARTMEIGEEEIYQYYQANLSSRFTLSDQRRAAHILLKVPADASAESESAIEERAREILERVRAGEEFSELARSYSEDPSASNGGDLGYFGADRMVPPFSEATLALEIGEISDLVRTRFGFHIIKLLDIQSQRVQSLEEVRDQIIPTLRFQMTMDAAKTNAQEIRDRMTGPDSFRQVAQEADLETLQTGLVTTEDELEGLGAGSRILSRVLFRLAPDEISEPTILPAGLGLIVLNEIVPGEIPPLAEIRDRVEMDANKERALFWLGEKVEEMENAAEPGNLAEIAKEIGAEVHNAPDLKRGGPLPELAGSTAFLEPAFDLPVGGWRGPERLPDGNLVVFHVTEKQGDPTELVAQRDSIRRDLLLGKRQLHMRAVLQRLREAHSVQINQNILASLNQTAP